MSRLIAALAVALLLSACATRFENHPLAAGQSNVERRTVDVSQPNRPLVLVAISGGGSRAAAFGWAVLSELRKYRYRSADGSMRPLTDDIAVISSVSGGSVIAAHFALEGAAGLDRFEPDFLALDNTRTLGAEAISPVRLVTGAARSDLVEQLFDRQLYGGKTFAALNQPGKPYLILNATDMASGQVFAFTPQRFDDICSDLDTQAISTGVAASAAVPVAFTPISLLNYSYAASTEWCRQRALPAWVSNRLDPKRLYAPYLNVDQFRLARYVNDLRNGPNPFRRVEHVYLLDGGLADNLAIHGLMETVASPFGAAIVAPPAGRGGPPQTVLQAINEGRVGKLVVIAINSRADPPNGIYASPDRPGIIGMIQSVTSLPIDAASADVKGQLDALLAQYKGFTGAPAIYDIELDFDQLRASDPAQLALRDEAKQIPTLWTISKPDLEVIEKVGTVLLQQHPCFRRLLGDLGIPADFTQPGDEYARNGCAQVSDRH